MKTIELLLLETVDNLGIVGDVVNVKPGFARNYLLPHSIAVTPTAEKIEELAARRTEEAARLDKLSAEQRSMIDKLEGYELTVERSANENGLLYGGVSQHEIAQALQAEGFAIDDRHVRIGDQIKRLDSYDIPIVINRDLKAEIKLWVVSDDPAVQASDDNRRDAPAEDEEAAEPVAAETE